MLKRIAAIAAALSIVPLTLAASPAQAAGYCHVSVPSKVSVTTPYRGITTRVTSSCAADYASWDVIHPTQGLEEILIFDGNTTDVMDWYDWSPLGTYEVRPGGAWDWNYDDVTQNAPTMTVRLGSRNSVSSTRSGAYVTVRAKVTRYSPNAGGFRPWSGAKVNLRQKSCSSCSWKWVKGATTNRDGQVTLKVYASTVRSWKLETSNTSSTWGAATTFSR